MESTTQTQTQQTATTDDILNQVVEEYVKSRGDGAKRLTALERKEVEHIARGLHAKEVAQDQNVSGETVRARRKKVYQKLDVDGALAIQAGVLTAAVKRLVTL